MFRAAMNLIKFRAVLFCETKQCIGMKLHLLKIYLTNVLNTLKEQLCIGLRLCLFFEFLRTSHENQQ